MSAIIGYHTCERAVYGIHCRGVFSSSAYRRFSADIQTSWRYLYSWPLQALFGDTISKTCFRKLTMKDAATSDHDDRRTHELLGSGLRPVLCGMWSSCASRRSHPMYIGVRVFNTRFSPRHCLGEP